MSQPAAVSSLPTALESQADAVVAQLRAAVRDHGRVTYSSSLGAESMVLTDLIFTQLPEIDVFTLDTGRLHEETYTLLDRLEGRYGRRVRTVHPQAADLESYVSTHGINGFLNGVPQRQACCHVRKILPFRHAVAGFGAWITGLRRDQSAARASAQPVEFDASTGLYKIAPLLDWTPDDVWTYIRARRLPYTPLHDRGFPSIGCAPCTRAVQPGEDARAGRWWWEQGANRECGLHPKFRDAQGAGGG